MDDRERGVMDENPGGRLCAKCGRHPASVQWVGEGGFLAFTHGHYAWWCRCCSTRAQLAYARKLARRIPRLQGELRRDNRRCAADVRNRAIDSLEEDSLELSAEFKRQIAAGRRDIKAGRFKTHEQVKRELGL